MDKTAFIERLLAKDLGPTSCRGRGGLAKLGPDTLKELFAGRRPLDESMPAIDIGCPLRYLAVGLQWLLCKSSMSCCRPLAYSE